MKIIDLHTHSKASDGSLTPSELVQHAKHKGLSAIALTDHDTIDGLQEALNTASKISIECIPGVEISVDYIPEMHILGYFSQKNYTKIQPTLKPLKEQRKNRNLKTIQKLNDLGLNVDYKELKKISPEGLIGRPHIALLLAQKGLVSSFSEAFDKYLAPGKLAYYKKASLLPQEGIQAIVEAGGVPVLAHPIYLQQSFAQLDKTLNELKNFGLKGIETFYTDHTLEDTTNLLKLAVKHKLICTGGSDFHGIFNKGVEIGIGRGNLQINYELYENIRNLFAVTS